MSPGLGSTYQDEEAADLTAQDLNLLEEPQKGTGSVQYSQNSQAVSSASAAGPRDTELSKG